MLRFVEKPSQDLAERYFDSGDFFWNVGIFLCKASTLIEMFETHAPDILAACRSALADATEDLSFKVLGDAYAQAPAISLDYAIAEKATNLRCVPLASAWSDVGSWPALWAFLEKNQDGNVVQGQGDIMLENVRNSYVYGDHGCVALVGVENLIVVAMTTPFSSPQRRRRSRSGRSSIASRATVTTKRRSMPGSTARGAGIKA